MSGSTSSGSFSPFYSSFFCGTGGVLSADIAVPKHDLEVQFYSRILTTGTRPLWRDDLMNNIGTPIIGLGAQSPEYAHLPLQWMPHIQVEDIASSVKNALGLGGSEVMHGKDDEGNSQWAVLLDPNGAAFGLIPVVSEGDYPADSSNGIINKNSSDNDNDNDNGNGFGCIAGLDLTVSNAPLISGFYQKVIGWSVKDIDKCDLGDADFEMIGSIGVPAARIRKESGKNTVIPPVWMLHIPVGDLVESLHRVKAEGGEVIKEDAVDGKCVYAVIKDPVGVYIALVQG